MPYRRMAAVGGEPVKALRESVLICGAALKGLDLLPDRCVRTVVTSPPYWSLRDYAAEGQIGRDDALGDYVKSIVVTFDKVRRVLAEDGTVWLNVGDSYTSGNRRYRAPDRKNRARAMRVRPATPEGLKPKDLIGVPWRLALALQDTGAATRAKRRSKLHVTDTGLASAMLGMTADSLNDPAEASRGPLHETFAVNELRRQASALAPELRFSHYRDSRGREIDLIVERPDGRIIAIEVKAGATVRPADAARLAWLRDLVGDRFETGVILHTGPRPVNISERILALPLSFLWQL